MRAFKPSSSASNKVKVYIRVRPLLEFDGTTSFSGLTTADSNDTGDIECIAYFNERKTIKGFNGIIGWDKSNLDVYHRALSKNLSKTYLGGSVSLFCYGHTGSGKTHTVLGYGDEPGLYELSATAILSYIAAISPELGLQIRFVELYNGKAFDLIHKRRQCELRDDGKGNLCYRAPVTRTTDGKVVVDTLEFEYVQTINAVREVMKNGIQQRVCGSSTLHNQSSRSHAIFEMEIVNEKLMTVRSELLLAEANIRMEGHARDKISKSIMDYYAKIYVKDEVTGKYGIDSNLEETLEAKDLKIQLDYFEKRFQEAENEVQRLKDIETEILDAVDCVGGKVILIDLAGADYDTFSTKQNAASMKEFIEINKSLLALKECIRCIDMNRGGKGTKSSRKNKVRVPYRDSKLTRILKPILEPNIDEEGQSKNQSIMIANIAPCNELKTVTLNTLKYSKLLKEADK